MKFEYVGFYPWKGKKHVKMPLGTIHIYCIDLGLDFRGIKVFRGKERLFFMPPGSTTKDSETGKMVRYPFLSFTNKQDQDEMLRFMIEDCSKEVEKELSCLKNDKKCTHKENTSKK